MTKKNLSTMQAPSVFKRTNVKKSFSRAVTAENARAAIGPLYPGCEIYGFTKGQFSVIEIMEHVILEAGPSEVTICTWSAASGDIRAANRLLGNNSITGLKFVIDYSFQSRKPHFCKELIDTFGHDCIRVTSIHAKFVLIKSAKYNLVIRTSMNLNFNPRFENFEISDDAEMYAFMQEIVDEIWKTQDAAQGFEQRPGQNTQQFRNLFTVDDLMPVDAKHLTPACLD